MGVLEINIYQIAVVLAVLLGKVNSQVTLSLGSQDPFQCDGKLRLRCTGTGSCCTQATGWTADGSSLTVGTSEDSKYKQENFGSYFDLVINKLELSDFNKIYTCAHLFDTSSVFKPSGRFYCNKCGGYGFLWVLSGVIVAFLICNLIVKLKGKKWAMKKLLVTSVASIFVSLTVSTSIAVPVCIINRLCQKTPRHDPLFILLGLAVEVMSFFIVSICFDKCCSGCRH